MKKLMQSAPIRKVWALLLIGVIWASGLSGKVSANEGELPKTEKEQKVGVVVTEGNRGIGDSSDVVDENASEVEAELKEATETSDDDTQDGEEEALVPVEESKVEKSEEVVSEQNGEVSENESEILEEQSGSLERVDEVRQEDEERYEIVYQAYIHGIGWQDWVTAGEPAGTTGKSLQVEALRIKVNEREIETFEVEEEKPNEDNAVDNAQSEISPNRENQGEVQRTVSSGIKYRVHIKNIGWQEWKKDGEIAGLEGGNLQIEAVQIKLTGEIKETKTIYYNTHVANFGWLGNAKEGEISGTESMMKRVEAFRIWMIPKNSPIEENGAGYYKGYTNKQLIYAGHVQDIGNISAVSGGKVLGTTGRAKRMEAIKIQIDTSDRNGIKGGIEYQTHVQNIGWQGWKKNGALAGTTGQSKRLEAIKINLTGELGKYYDIYYRTHIESYGWLGWAKNGQAAGSEGMALRMEAIQICLVIKGGNAPGNNSGYFKYFPRSKFLNVANISQYPDFPNGCEPIALNIVLNHYGYNLSKRTVCYTYLPRGPLHSTNPYVAYMGDPALSKGGYGCWAPVIVKTANDIFDSRGIKSRRARDISGSSTRQLYQYVAEGKPVIIWGTINMGNSSWFYAGFSEGKAVYWPTKEHCMVLTGYDMNRGIIKVNDPIRGQVEYKMSAFEDAYFIMGKNAVLIE